MAARTRLTLTAWATWRAGEICRDMLASVSAYVATVCVAMGPHDDEEAMWWRRLLGGVAERLLILDLA